MVQPLPYNAGLNLQDAEEKYREVHAEFERVKSHYSGFFGKFKRNLRGEDNKTLVDCMGVLLPLGLEAAVQDQVREAQAIKDTLHYRLGELTWHIVDYLANFKNTGVTRVQGNL